MAAKDGKAPVAWKVISISDLLILPMAFYTHLTNTPAWLVVQSIIKGLGPYHGSLRGVTEMEERHKVVSSDGYMERVKEEEEGVKEAKCHRTKQNKKQFQKTGVEQQYSIIPANNNLFVSLCVVGIVHENVKMGSDGESDQASGTSSDEVQSPVRVRMRNNHHRRISNEVWAARDMSHRLSLDSVHNNSLFSIHHMLYAREFYRDFVTR